MKKLIFISLVAICSVGMTNIARGATCEALNLSGSCPGNGTGNDSYVITNSNCISTSSNCKYVTCNGSCHCALNGVCSGSGGDIGTIEMCSGTPTWNSTLVSLNGVDSGTCTTNKGNKWDVYRCKDGYYTSAYCSAGYSYSEPTCTACPHHLDYVRSGQLALGGAPSYVTTGGAGCKKITNCQIKANSGISGATGTFVFESACSYAS